MARNTTGTTGTTGKRIGMESLQAIANSLPAESTVKAEIVNPQLDSLVSAQWVKLGKLTGYGVKLPNNASGLESFSAESMSVKELDSWLNWHMVLFKNTESDTSAGRLTVSTAKVSEAYPFLKGLYNSMAKVMTYAEAVGDQTRIAQWAKKLEVARIYRDYAEFFADLRTAVACATAYRERYEAAQKARFDALNESAEQAELNGKADNLAKGAKLVKSNIDRIISLDMKNVRSNVSNADRLAEAKIREYVRVFHSERAGNDYRVVVKYTALSEKKPITKLFASKADFDKWFYGSTHTQAQVKSCIVDFVAAAGVVHKEFDLLLGVGSFQAEPKVNLIY